MTDPSPLTQIVRLLRQADSLVITAGAGMGIDSGLPDFRGAHGFWRAYPALGRAGLSFEDMANPRAFRDNLRQAWGFYGHRLNLYRGTDPHIGFQKVLDLGKQFPGGFFVFTSNVDGQFQKAGFPEDRIVECHGSIHFLQCLNACRPDVWKADSLAPQIDEPSCRLLSLPPACPSCGSPARPNVLMFGDGEWVGRRTRQQILAFREWFQSVSRPVALEIGAGESVPTVRNFGEALGCPLVRINPQEWEVCQDKNDVGWPIGAKEGLGLLTDTFGRRDRPQQDRSV